MDLKVRALNQTNHKTQAFLQLQCVGQLTVWRIGCCSCCGREPRFPSLLRQSSWASRVDLPALARGTILGLSRRHHSVAKLVRHDTSSEVWIQSPIWGSRALRSGSEERFVGSDRYRLNKSMRFGERWIVIKLLNRHLEVI
ncbi:MAG: hypothetical protein ACE5I5_13240 [Candidatus Heimdallarchaeota archaeon]